MRPAPTRPPGALSPSLCSRTLVDDCVCVRLGVAPLWPRPLAGAVWWGRSPRAARGGGLRAGWSSMNGRRPRTQCARLVVHADRDAADLLFVLTRVMGAEHQFAAARQLEQQIRSIAVS